MADFSRLPGPNADLWDWQLRGLCRGKDSSLFFHPEGERGAARSSRETAAKEICMNCPVQIPCADHALKVREPYGVWGGMTEEEREEHHARQKALVRAQAARDKAARLRQEQVKEKLLREKELENQRKQGALASPVTVKADALVKADMKKDAVATAPRNGSAKSTRPAAKKPTTRKSSKTLVKA
jgi:WhiB family redox-sensing transcriptional regulator